MAAIPRYPILQLSHLFRPRLRRSWIEHCASLLNDTDRGFPTTGCSGWLAFTEYNWLGWGIHTWLMFQLLTMPWIWDQGRPICRRHAAECRCPCSLESTLVHVGIGTPVGFSSDQMINPLTCAIIITHVLQRPSMALWEMLLCQYWHKEEVSSILRVGCFAKPTS